MSSKFSKLNITEKDIRILALKKITIREEIKKLQKEIKDIESTFKDIYKARRTEKQREATRKLIIFNKNGKMPAVTTVRKAVPTPHN